MSDMGVTQLRHVMGFKNAGVYCPANVTPEELIKYSSACSSFAAAIPTTLILFTRRRIRAQHGGPNGTGVSLGLKTEGAPGKHGAGVARPPLLDQADRDRSFPTRHLYIAMGGSFERGGGIYVSIDGGRQWTRAGSDFTRDMDFYSQVVLIWNAPWSATLGRRASLYRGPLGRRLSE